MAEQHLITAEFFGNPVSILDHDGRQWLTAEQAGRCLGYKEALARISITRVYNRHQDEFTEEDTGEVSLSTPGGQQECRIFSSTGCSKLGFFARTARAKEFRTWASKVLSKKLAAPVAPPAEVRSPRLEASLARMADSVATLADGMQTMQTQLNVTAKYIGLLEINQKGRTRVTAETAREARALHAEGMTYGDIGRLLRISYGTARLLVLDKYPIVPPQPGAAPKGVGEILEGWIEREQAKLTATLTKGGL